MPGADSSAAQRERLLEAMVTIAARYGYGGASVARVVREAGVSRATFYECFKDREDCFRDAYRRVAGEVKDEIAGVRDGSPASILERMLTDGERRPAAAQVFLVESLAAPPAVRADHERLLHVAREALEGYLARQDDGVRLELPVQALLGGIGGVVGIRVFRGEAGQLSQLHGDLLAWVESYAVDAGDDGQLDWAGLGEGLRSSVELPPPVGAALEEKPLPRGRGALGPSMVAERQRMRILAAVARLCRDRGYDAISVAKVVSTAGVTREVFYELFRDKQDAFLAAQALGLEQSVSISAGRFFSEESWPDRVWNGLSALLSYVSSQPDLVYVDLIETYAAGPAAIRRSFENRMAFTVFLEQGFRQSPAAEAMPRICAEAIAGAIQELMRLEVEEGRRERVLALLPRAVYIALAPFVGVEAARDLVARRAAAALATD